MGFSILVKDYIVWHYGKAIRDGTTITRDLLWFGYHFFSLPTHIRTLFSPFARIRAEGFSITEIEASLQNLTANIISRAVGFILRIIVIITGVIAQTVLASAIAATFVSWLILPFIILFLLAFSVGVL